MKTRVFKDMCKKEKTTKQNKKVQTEIEGWDKKQRD